MMSEEKINENLVFLRKYTDDLKERDEYTVQMLSGSKETKEEIIGNLLRIIKDYEALLG
jgi:hypothetical protein